jgi:hypothetical protein
MLEIKDLRAISNIFFEIKTIFTGCIKQSKFALG